MKRGLGHPAARCCSHAGATDAPADMQAPDCTAQAGRNTVAETETTDVATATLKTFQHRWQCFNFLLAERVAD